MTKHDAGYIRIQIKCGVNELLVKEGYPQVATYPPNVRYVEKFREAEKYARENKKGLWKD